MAKTFVRPLRIEISGVAGTWMPDPLEASASACAGEEANEASASASRKRGFVARMKERAIQGAIDRGATREDAEAVLLEIGDGKFLDWLMNGGLEKIIELILKLIGLIG